MAQGGIGRRRRDQRTGEGFLIGDRQPQFFSVPDGLSRRTLQRIDHEVGDRSPLDLGRPLDRAVKIGIHPRFQPRRRRPGTTGGPDRRERGGFGIHGGIFVG